MSNRVSFFKRLGSYFFQGLLITVPITVTLVVIVKAIVWIDNLVPINVPITLPGIAEFDLPGFGILFLLLVITILGYFASTLVANPVFSVVEKLLERTPLLKVIYTSMKDLVEAFVGEKKRFTKPVLVTVNNNPVIQRIGFVTEDDLTRLGIEKNKMAVYLPFSYGFNGQLVIVETTSIQELDVNGTEMMKFIISGGVTDI
ncbi:MAG: DUF502 domain-containing protein [Bacteroidota bacterium]|jgi:uncharacterized membrane protein